MMERVCAFHGCYDTAVCRERLLCLAPATTERGEQ